MITVFFLKYLASLADCFDLLSCLELSVCPNNNNMNLLSGNQISSRLLSFSSANCLLILPGRTKQLEVLPAGTQVDALIIARV